MAEIIHISEAASIAFHIMALVAARHGGEPLSAREMTEMLGVSEHHLRKVTLRLAKAGLVEAQRGPRGGVLLKKQPSKILLLDIFEAIEGRLEVKTCFLKDRRCKPGNCIFGGLLGDLNSQVKNYLKATKLSDLTGIFKE